MRSKARRPLRSKARRSLRCEEPPWQAPEHIRGGSAGDRRDRCIPTDDGTVGLWTVSVHRVAGSVPGGPQISCRSCGASRRLSTWVGGRRSPPSRLTSVLSGSRHPRLLTFYSVETIVHWTLSLPRARACWRVACGLSVHAGRCALRRAGAGRRGAGALDQAFERVRLSRTTYETLETKAGTAPFSSATARAAVPLPELHKPQCNLDSSGSFQIESP